ncbi:MAG: HEAT repeat domain-containing protein [Myxococcota bacterium]|nr:HEAT repeat domain-containing protein [Myxococcota bacterium]
MNQAQNAQLHIQIHRSVELQPAELNTLVTLAQQCRNRYNHIFQDFHLFSVDGHPDIRLELILRYRPHRGMPFGFKAIERFLNAIQQSINPPGDWTIVDELVLLRKNEHQFSFTQGSLLPYHPPLPFIKKSFKHPISTSIVQSPKELEEFRDFLNVVAFRSDDSLYASDYLRLGLRYQEELMRQFADGPNNNAAAKLLQPLLFRGLIDDPSIRIVAKRQIREGSSETRRHASRILILAAAPSKNDILDAIQQYGIQFSRNIKALQRTTDTLQGIDTANTSAQGIIITDVVDGIIQSPGFLIAVARRFELTDYLAISTVKSEANLTGLCLLVLHMHPFHYSFPGLKQKLINAFVNPKFHWSTRALSAHTLYRLYPDCEHGRLFIKFEEQPEELKREIFRVVADLPGGLGRDLLRKHYSNPKYTSWVLQASAIHSDPIILQMAKKQYKEQEQLFQSLFLKHLRDLAGSSTRTILQQIKDKTVPSLKESYSRLQLMLCTIRELQQIHLRLPQLLTLLSYASQSASFIYWPLVTQATAAAQPTLREAAADVLGAYASPVCTPYLLDLLNDPIEGVALAAIKALGSTGDTKAFPVLRELARGKSSRRTYARIAIRELGNPPQATDPKVRLRIHSPSPLTPEERQVITEVLQESKMIAQFQLRNIEGVLPISDSAVPLLHRLCTYFNTIHQRYSHFRWSIHDTYGLLRYDGHQFFVSNTKGQLIRAAGWIGNAPQSGHFRQLVPADQSTQASERSVRESGPAVERLRTVLKDNGRDPDLEGIYLSGVSEAEVEVLIDWLKSENIQRVIEACIIIKRLAVEQTLPYLSPLLTSHEIDVQRYAIDALGHIGNKETLEVLRAKSASISPPLRSILQESIASIESALSV